MFRREQREYISPLLQPPLNRLFVPRATADYLPPADRDNEERTYVRVHPTAPYIPLLAAAAVSADTPSADGEEGENKDSDAASKAPHGRSAAAEARRLKALQRVEADLATWDAGKNEAATEDAFKTLFVGRLPFDITEARVKREFERFGPVKQVKMVVDTVTGRARGYAFVEFEKEKDTKVAYIEADGMRIEGGSRRIVVDIERGRTVKGWRPRRLGGGLGRTRVGSKEKNQRHSGRDPRANDVLEELVRRGHHVSRKRSASPPRDRDRIRDYRGRPEERPPAPRHAGDRYPREADDRRRR